MSAQTFASPQVATIAVDFNNPGTPSDPCDVAPWTDATAAAPVGGNPGTTVGSQRQNALKYAVQQISNQLQPPVPITIRACWDSLGGTATRAVIANASPTTFLVDEPYYGGYVLPLRYTWYAITEAVRQGGTAQCGLIGGACGASDNEEIVATFNSDIGIADRDRRRAVLLRLHAIGRSLDFVSVAMHEITHGMGFIGLANTDSTLGPVGAKAGVANNTVAFQNLDIGPYDDVFDVNAAIVDFAAGTYVPFMGYEVNGSRDAARASALVSTNGLRWSGAEAVNSTVKPNRGLAGARWRFPLLYAPNPVVNGSTLSHTGAAGRSDECAQYPEPPPRTLGLAAPMLAPLGWSARGGDAPAIRPAVPEQLVRPLACRPRLRFPAGRAATRFSAMYTFWFFMTYDQSGMPEWGQPRQGNSSTACSSAESNSDGNTLLYSTYGSNLGFGQLKPTPQAELYGQRSPSTLTRPLRLAGLPRCRPLRTSRCSASCIWTHRPDRRSATTEDSAHRAPCHAEPADASPDYNGHWFAPAGCRLGHG